MKYLEILAGSNSPGDKDWTYLPYIFIAIGNILWPTSFIYANQHNINFAQSMMIRGITLILANYALCRWFNSPTDFKDPTIFRVHVFRGSLMVVFSILFASSQYILPLPIIHTLNCSGTLFIFLIDYQLNNVKINSKQGIGIFIGFIGALIATNSKILTKIIDPQYKDQTHFQNYITDDPIFMALFSIVFLGAIFCWGLAIVITKKAKSNTFQINYTLGINLVFYGTLFYPFLQSKATKIQLFISLFTLGLPLVLGQWLFIGALTMTKNTGVLNMMNFITIFVGYLISIFRYGQTPNIFSLIAVGFVVVGVYKTIMNRDTVQSNNISNVQISKSAQH